jgi:hypothetical protein
MGKEPPRVGRKAEADIQVRRKFLSQFAIVKHALTIKSFIKPTYALYSYNQVNHTIN